MIGRHDWRFTHTLVLATVLLAAAGCSSQSGDELPREAVSGTVTLDDQPLADGLIQFTPAGGSVEGGTPTGGGSTIKGGSFYISRETGLVPGNYNVAINAAAPRGERTKPAQVGAGKAEELAKELIPAKYNAKTTLKTEIKKGGSNSSLKFELQSK
jgi:hypothetical protein